MLTGQPYDCAIAGQDILGSYLLILRTGAVKGLEDVVDPLFQDDTVHPVSRCAVHVLFKPFQCALAEIAAELGADGSVMQHTVAADAPVDHSGSSGGCGIQPPGQRFAPVAVLGDGISEHRYGGDLPGIFT